jgi:L-arabinose transport system substrate-binding protein
VAGDQPTIVFAVADLHDPWARKEIKLARDAASKDRFNLLAIAVPNSQSVFAMLKRAETAKAQGIIICSPDVHLGPAILKATTELGIKLMAVDSRLVDGSGRPLKVPYVGIDSAHLGTLAGKAMAKEAGARRWDYSRTRLLVLESEGESCPNDRVISARKALQASGFTTSNTVTIPLRQPNVDTAKSAVLGLIAKNPLVRNWFVVGPSDEAAMGAVRATEQACISASRVIAVGFNGDESIYELRKPAVTGFFGSVLLDAKAQGYDAADHMYHWIKSGTVPPLEVRTEGKMITHANYRDFTYRDRIWAGCSLKR